MSTTPYLSSASLGLGHDVAKSRRAAGRGGPVMADANASAGKPSKDRGGRHRSSGPARLLRSRRGPDAPTALRRRSRGRPFTPTAVLGRSCRPVTNCAALRFVRPSVEGRDGLFTRTPTPTIEGSFDDGRDDGRATSPCGLRAGTPPAAGAGARDRGTGGSGLRRAGRGRGRLGRQRVPSSQGVEPRRLGRLPVRGGVRAPPAPRTRPRSGRPPF